MMIDIAECQENNWQGTMTRNSGDDKSIQIA